MDYYNNIAFKLCGKCEVVKDVTQFSKYKTSKDGRQPWCRQCAAQYRQTPKGKASQVKFDAKWNASNRDRRAAHARITMAVRKGDLEKASDMACAGTCGKSAAHWHHDSYREENHLDVTPYCVKCHRAWHRLNEVVRG